MIRIKSGKLWGKYLRRYTRLYSKEIDGNPIYEKKFKPHQYNNGETFKFSTKITLP